MPDDASRATLRAAVDTILPGDGVLPAGSALEVDRHVAESAEKFLPGFVDVIATLLDAYAAERGAASFVALDEAARQSVLRELASEESADLRDAADALFTFSYGGMYSEWTGFDPVRRVLRAPASWARTGYHGPSLGHPDFRGGAPPPNPEVRDVSP